MLASLASLTAAAQVQLGEWGSRYPGFRAAGTLCSYMPAELIHAAGFSPVRVRAMGIADRQADSHLPSYTCALSRGVLNLLSAGEIGCLDGLAFAHTCDTLQALADICRLDPSAPGWVETLMLPANLDSPACASYLSAELARFRDRLALVAGWPVRDQEIRASIGLYDEIRHLVQALQGYRDRLSASDYFAIMDAGQSMPPGLFRTCLSTLLGEIDTLPRLARQPCLFLTGAMLDEPRLTRIFDDLGAQIAGDDLCTGSRRYLGQVGNSGDSLADLARHIMQRSPCPCKRQASQDATQVLLEQVQRAHATGLVFLLPKYCEPQAFQYALLRPALEKAGVPCLALDVEQVPSIEALMTRVQAFTEIL